MAKKTPATITANASRVKSLVKPGAVVLVSALLAGGLAYGIKISLTSTTTTTVDTRPAARAQVTSMLKIANNTADALGAALRKCGNDAPCASTAGATALTSVSAAASMVTLDLYPDKAAAGIQNFLDDIIAMQKTYLKVSEATSMQAIFTNLQPWPGELAYARQHAKDLLALLK